MASIGQSLRHATLALVMPVVIAANSVLAAPSDSCTLSPRLLELYGHLQTKPEDFGKLRRTVETFVSNCPNGPADHASRKVFFDLLDHEFRTDFAPQLAQARSETELDARWEAIMTFQSDLSHYLDTIVVPSDIEFKDTILHAGSGKAIAALGPPVKSDVLPVATTAGHELSGFEHHHNAQEAAFQALGFWLSPEDRNFGPADKASFTSILAGALDASEGVVHSGGHQALIMTIVSSLGRSDDLRASEALRRFAAKLPDQRGEVYEGALKSAEAVEARSRRTHA